MHHGTQKIIRLPLILLGVFVCCPTIVQAVDDDGILVPGDPNDYVVLSDLTNSQRSSVSVGDKVFSVFSYSNSGDMPAATEINVFGFQDADDNYGLTLQGGFLDNPGDDVGSSATLNFKVGVSDEGQQQGRRISDAHLFLEGSGVPQDSEISVDESFEDASETLRVFDSDVGGQPDLQLSDWVDFSETALDHDVTLLISALTAEEADLPAHASVIDLSFSQIVVPEPSAALLVMCAAVFCGAGRFHRSSR